MFKRTWLLVVALLVIGAALSACGSGDLAEDLTPIPTFSAGEEPALVQSIQDGMVAAEAAPPVAVDEGAAEAGTGGDAGAASVTVGREVFTVQCSGCHAAEDGIGPAFTGMGVRAADRIEGVSAADYLHESIVNPSAYVVDGYQNIMGPNYGDTLDADEIDGLVAYILAESGDEETAPPSVEDEGEPAEAEEVTPMPTEAEAATPVPTEAEDEEATPVPTEAEDADEGESAEDVDEGEPAAAEQGDAELGADLFANACAACHSDVDSAGPARVGMGMRAAERVEGMSAAEYVHTSIIDPSAYVVEPFSDIMPKTYEEQYNEHELNSIVSYVLTQ